MLLLESCGGAGKDPTTLNTDPSHFTSTSAPIKGTLHWPFPASIHLLLIAGAVGERRKETSPTLFILFFFFFLTY